MEELRHLVERAQAGDLEAYGEIVRRFQDMAYGYAYSILSDFHLAQDAAQEAFVQAYRDLKALRRAAAFPGWFRQIVFKHCDRIRRGRSTTQSLDAAGREALSDEAGPPEAAEKQELRDRVLAAVRSLPEHQRTVTTLFYINGYTVNEIADFLEAPAGTVKRRLHDSRTQLKERMMAMVADTFKEHGLPDGFSEQTVQKALEQARQLDKERKWIESEQMLRQVLGEAPSHPELLRALNHALQRGRIWKRQQYRLVPELVEHGGAILEALPDQADVHRNIAETLLYVPDMPAAVEFIETWIRRKGPSLESLRRLAWAHACMRHDEEREAVWDQFMAAVRTGNAEGGTQQLTGGAGAMVDCLASSGQVARAQELLQQAWKLVRERSEGDLRWALRHVELFKQAGLAEEAVALAREYHGRLAHGDDTDANAQGTALMVRAWFDESEALLADWLAWVRRTAAAGDSKVLQALVPRILITFERMGGLAERRVLGLETASVLRNASDEKIAQLAHSAHNSALAPEVHIDAGDLGAAEQAVAEAVAAGYPEEAEWLYDVAILRSEPSPQDLMELIEEKGVDEAPHGALYHVAREAAAAGDDKKAFEFLRRTCEECWWVRPNVRLRMWENDGRWGQLRSHPEFRGIIEKKQRRVGPATGQLMYHPGW